jgi:Fe-Mn family superoxide dismutase
MHKMIALFMLLFSSVFSVTNYVAKDYSSLLGMPGFSDELLQMHFKLYEGYVKNSNELLAKLAGMAGTSSYEYGALKRRLGWEFDGMRLHELYFDNLGGSDGIDKKSGLYEAIVDQFGSFEKWKKDFIATGTIRGIGWAMLYIDLEQMRLINVWINEHDVGHLVRAKPLLIMDVFEHAYMPQYGLDRAKYIDAFFKNIDWAVVAKRYNDALR